MLIGMGVAFLMLTFTTSNPFVMLSVCLIGFGQDALFLIIILKDLDQVRFHQADETIAITFSFIFLGGFLASIVLDAIGGLVNNDTIRFQYGLLSVSIIVIATINLVYLLKQKKRAK